MPRAGRGAGNAACATADPARRHVQDRQRDADRGAEASLRNTASALLLEPGVRLEVAGYTDDTGSRATNERLSLERALVVRAFLVSAGVPANQLTARGYGPADPIASNATAAGRALNRRVELRRVGVN